MRNYQKIDGYLDKLRTHLYAQPTDEGHITWTTNALNSLCGGMAFQKVLDVGCGQGFAQEIFKQFGNPEYVGVTLGEDYTEAKKQGKNVFLHDMSFLPYSDGNFDLVFARHVLEHSPIPLLTLMEWNRVSSKYLVVVAPHPEYWGYVGINHYYMFTDGQLFNLFMVSKWRIVKRELFYTDSSEFMQFYLPEQTDRSKVVFPGNPKIVELRYLLEKV